MKSASDLLKGEVKTMRDEANTPNFSPEQKKVWAKVWAMLEASRLVQEPVTSSTSLYWMSQVINTPPERLLAAARELTNKHKGYLTLGHLTACIDDQRGSKAHQQFLALPKKGLPGDELKSRIKKMREELNI